MDMTLSSATIPCQSGPESNGNEGVLHILRSSRITSVSPSDFLMSYPGHSLVGGSYLSAEMQLVYSTSPADWAAVLWGLNSFLLQFGIWDKLTTNCIIVGTLYNILNFILFMITVVGALKVDWNNSIRSSLGKIVS